MCAVYVSESSNQYGRNETAELKYIKYHFEHGGLDGL
jgi:hypothetical protein